jgi:outer membrane protein
MTSKTLAAAMTALIAFSSGSAALAQTRGRTAAPARTTAAAPAASAISVRHGAPIPGVCVFNGQAAVATSAVGQAANNRMRVLLQQVQAEIGAEATPLQNDIKTFQSQRASLTPDQAQQRATPIQQRQDALEQKANLRQRELQATQQQVLERINHAMQPLVLQVYQAHNCSMLLAGETVTLVNPAMDITPQVVQQLNATMPSISFDRVTAPPGAATAPR